MNHLSACPVCQSQKIKDYSFTPTRDRQGALHFAQSHCKNCDIVFSNPVATEEELAHFYKEDYYQNHEEVFNPENPKLEALLKARAKDEDRLIQGGVLPYIERGEFFEIGAGFGPVLEAARLRGFVVSGVEPSVKAVEVAKKVFGITSITTGTFNAADYPKNFYDFIYSFQVIEHLVDLKNFVTGTFSMLKPGGVMLVGTENHRNALVFYRKIRHWLKGEKLPEFQTADHHTFYFSDKSLKNLLHHYGFEILKSSIYTVPLRVDSKNSSLKIVLRKILAKTLYFIDQITGGGNRVLVWCRKPLNPC